MIKNTETRYEAKNLLRFASQVLWQTGMTKRQSADVAEILVEGDLMGHGTHGLQLLTGYVQEIENRKMRTHGQPTVLADNPSSFTWDGKFLPGPWLVRKALHSLFERSDEHAVCTAVIRRSHHIACLAAYLKEATDRGLIMLLTCSDPAVASVAPHGAHAGRYTPNPIAAGFPTEGLPVLIDISASTTTNGMIARMQRSGRGEKLPGRWLVDNEGRDSDDPAVMLAEPPGAILPLGGMDLGYKGFALGLLVEALTSALAGHGRADGETRWGASVFIQVINPEHFAGIGAFRRETGWLSQACRTAPVAPGKPAVRLPGERGQLLRAEQLAKGVALHPETVTALVKLGHAQGVVPPAPHRT